MSAAGPQGATVVVCGVFSLSLPRPPRSALFPHPTLVLSIRQEVLAALDNPSLARRADGATLPAITGQVVMTTDSSVVSPLFFPGGDIGRLAVHSALNDLAVCAIGRAHA